MKLPDFRNAVKNALKDKKLRYGGYATLLTALVIGLIIALNVVTDQIPASLDMTKNRYFSLSEQTYHILDNLDQDVTIYAFFQIGNENARLDEVLQKYDVRSKHLTVKHIDPVRNPGFANKFKKEGRSL